MIIISSIMQNDVNGMAFNITGDGNPDNKTLTIPVPSTLNWNGLAADSFVATVSEENSATCVFNEDKTNLILTFDHNPSTEGETVNIATQYATL